VGEGKEREEGKREEEGKGRDRPPPFHKFLDPPMLRVHTAAITATEKGGQDLLAACICQESRLFRRPRGPPPQILT